MAFFKNECGHNCACPNCVRERTERQVTMYREQTKKLREAREEYERELLRGENAVPAKQ